MASVISKKKARAQLISTMKKQTHFHKDNECENLVKEFDNYCEKDGTCIVRAQFREFLFKTFGITDDNILDRVFRAFDQDNDGKISLDEWIRGMSVYTRGNIDEQAKFCFQVYDVNADGNLSRDEMFHFLKNCITSKAASDDDPDEGVREIIEIALKLMKAEQGVPPQVYTDTVKRDSLMLECLGQCLPSESAVREYEQHVICRDNHRH